MKTSYLIPARETHTELAVQNSRFIAFGAPALDVEQAREFISRIKKEFPDATHHVPAYIIGSGNSSLSHCSDDGEPSGTAGKPVLSVLQGSNIRDLVVVVVRYFGGTKLGTGGLVRAYTDSTKELVKKIPLARKISTYTCLIELPYAYYDRFILLAQKYSGEVLDREFSDIVLITLRIDISVFDAFNQSLGELTNGIVKAVIVDEDSNSIMPID